MGDLFFHIKSSSGELKKLRNLTLIAMFMAIDIVLNFLTIQITSGLHISFGFLVTAAIGMLFGPIPSVLFGFTTDILCYFVNPKGAYFFGYTITAIVGALIYALVLYKKVPTIKRCILAKISTTFICNIILNSLWVSMLIGKSFFSLIFSVRIFKSIVLFPLEVFLLFIILKFLMRIMNRVKRE